MTLAPLPPHTVRDCPVCGWEFASTVYECAGLPRVVSCNKCGMVFADTAKKQSEYDLYYAEQSKYVNGFDEWNGKRYAEAAERISRVVPKNAYLYDVGCATGGLLMALRLQGYENLKGADPSKECVAIAAERLPGVKVKQRSLFEVSGVYGCVILSHVLEHVRDIAGAMRKLTEIAETVWVEVPDAARYWEHEASPWQQFNAEHIQHFSLPHLRQLFERHGFEIRACGEYECDPCRFPALWAYFGRKRTMQDAIRAYCDKSESLMHGMEQTIRAIDGPVICWGIGALARKLEPILLRCKIAIDSNPGQANWYNGALVSGPAGVAASSNGGVWSDYPIIVTTVLHKDSVLRQIEELKLANRVITL